MFISNNSHLFYMYYKKKKKRNYREIRVPYKESVQES